MKLSKESKQQLILALLSNNNGEVQEENSNTSETNHPYKVGQSYLIRTVTMALTGRLVGVHKKELILEDSAWIADTGRFSKMLKDPSELKEVEPSEGRVILGRDAIIDCYEWNHKLPRRVK